MRQQTDRARPVPTARSPGPQGLRALERWLREGFGRSTTRLEGRRLEIPEDVALLVVARPSYPLSRADEDRVAAFVESGGWLLVLGDARTTVGEEETRPLVHQFGFEVRDLGFRATTASPTSGGPDVEIDADTALEPPEGARVLLSSGGDLLAVSLDVGEGRVIAFVDDSPFTNEGLRRESGAALVDFTLRDVPPGRVAFDEIHHGFGESPGLSDALTRTSSGAALLFVLAAVFLHLVLSGRRFARPLPIRRRRPRPASDFVVAMAETYRRAGRSRELFRELARGWRRRLARRLALSPDAPDAALAGAAARAFGGSADEIERTLARLRRRPGTLARRTLLRRMDEIAGPYGDGRHRIHTRRSTR
jgi:hypothetical protein